MSEHPGAARPEERGERESGPERPRQFWAATERARLCDLLDEVGPDSPTLCQGWSTGDLAAHLVIRESAPLAATGIFVPALAAVTARAMARVRHKPFPATVNRIRRGGLLPLEGRLAEALHLLEFAVHRQDILRASASLDRMPDHDDAGLQAAVFGHLRRRANQLGRAIPAGIGLLLRSPGHGSIDVRRAPAVLIVDGEPIELALWLFGRVAASGVTIGHRGGTADVQARVEAALRR